jgi:3-deoxy-manno-octulosonate cytidylyltransferase (CMP-KDO synthetase)
MTGRVLAVIPARLGSTRLDRKALKLIGDKTLVRRVWEQASGCKTLTEIVVATDSSEIESEVNSFGGKVVMTSADLQTGSDRVAAVYSMMIDGKWDLVINIQGDMPFIDPELVDGVIKFAFDRRNDFDVYTVGIPLTDGDEFRKNSVVKIAISREQRGLYFSRASIPHSRDGDTTAESLDGQPVVGYKHLGLYVFRPEILLKFPELTPGTLEKIEKLEQLRLLEAGFRIGVYTADPRLVIRSVEVDTEADLLLANQLVKISQ